MKKWYLWLLLAMIAVLAALPWVCDREDLRLEETNRQELPGSARFAALSAGTTHYSLDGDDARLTVVLIHGTSGPMMVWERITPLLVEAGYRVLRYDLFGRGYSDRIDADYGLDVYITQLEELLATIEPTSDVVLVGSSLGAIIAAEYATRHETAVRGVVLVGPAGFPLEASPLASLTQVAGLGEYLMSVVGHDQLVTHHRRYFQQPERFEAHHERFAEQLRYGGSKRAILDTLRHAPLQRYLDGYERLGQRSVPVLVIWGLDDRVFPYAHHQELAARLPEATLVAVEAAGHLPQLEQPERTAAELRRFLDPIRHGDAPADWLILSNFTLIDGTGAPARNVETLRVRNGVIVAIDGEGGGAPPAEGDAVVSVDLAGGFVMPGLVDTHVHVGRFPKARVEAERILKAAVRGGVTSVRDLGGDARALAEAERAMMNGEFVGATLAHSALFGGESLFAQDRRLADHAAGFAPGTAPWSKAVTEASDLRVAVAEARGAGATIAKLYGNLDAPLAGRLIAEAERQGLKTAAHATVFPAGPSALVVAGIDSLSHAPYLVWEGAQSIPADYEARTRGPWAEIPSDHPKLLAVYDLMAERGVFLDATLFVYRNMANYSPAVDADWTGAAFVWAMQAVRVAHERGVRITAGTDWFEPRSEAELPHTHDELALLVEAGLSPMEAIVAGTRNGAEAMGAGATRGTIAVGKAADLLVLDANPLADIRNTTKLRLVVKDGRIVTRD